MKPIKFNSKNYQLATSWDELTREQYLRVCYVRTAYMQIENETELHEARIIIFKTICSIPWHKTNKIEPEQWFDLLPHVDFLLNAPKLTNNPLQFIKVGFTTQIFAPVGLMSTSSISEFIAAEDAFLSFMLNKKVESAWLLMAILYRKTRLDIKQHRNNPDTWNNDVREPFNIINAKVNADRYSKSLPAYFATAVLFFFESVRTRSFINNPLLKPLFQGSSNGSNQAGWIKTVLMQSGKKFGDFKQTSNENWLLFMVELASEMERSKSLTA